MTWCFCEIIFVKSRSGLRSGQHPPSHKFFTCAPLETQTKNLESFTVCAHFTIKLWIVNIACCCSYRLPHIHIYVITLAFLCECVKQFLLHLLTKYKPYSNFLDSFYQATLSFVVFLCNSAFCLLKTREKLAEKTREKRLLPRRELFLFGIDDLWP